MKPRFRPGLSQTGAKPRFGISLPLPPHTHSQPTQVVNHIQVVNFPTIFVSDLFDENTYVEAVSGHVSALSEVV